MTPGIGGRLPAIACGAEPAGAYHGAAYTAKVRVSVRAGDITIVREGSGTGEGKAPTPGQAHELALKGAETDATKRALATFGNPFGLALYDREQLGVRKARNGEGFAADRPLGAPLGIWCRRSKLRPAKRVRRRPTQGDDRGHDIELLFAIWEQNVETVRALNRSLKQDPLPKSGIAPQLVNHLKHCAIALVKPEKPSQWIRPSPSVPIAAKADPPQDRQERADHQRAEADSLQGASALCGKSALPDLRTLALHAHHIRYAQSRGLGLKVSDEFTVPLCAIHHHQIHTTGKEQEWWQERNIDPLKIASALWRQSRQQYATREASLPEPSRDPTEGRPEAADDSGSKPGGTAARTSAPIDNANSRT